MTDALVRVLDDDQAMVNVTYNGQNGELPDPVHVSATEVQIRAMVTEAMHAGGVRGIAADANANFANFIVERFEPTEARPHRLIMLRPKTEFGMAPGGYRPSIELPNITQAPERVTRCPHCCRPY